ncbi:MAG: hypothetical protein IH623_23790 [Verrucomicrobia bacterium]|nr:hypothetical protein [Verrucomicrobiota bacterium]
MIGFGGVIVVALIGFGGVIVGAVVSIAGQFAVHWLQERPRRKADEERKKLLTKMLNHPKDTWRNLDRLKHVIGADDETTKRLLLELGARGSEDGQNLWGLLSRNPFKDEQ